MLDAARALILAGGAAAASARAVSVALGAPSGSIYHQFPRRDDLIAATWLRAQDRFLGAYLAELGQPSTQAGTAAAVTVLTWSGKNPDDAALLLRHSLRDLLHGDLSPELAGRVESDQQQLREALATFAAHTERDLADILVAVVDLPYAVTRRILHDQRSPTEVEVSSLERAVDLLLQQARK